MKSTSPKKKLPLSNSSSRCLFVWLTIVNVFLFSAEFYTYLSAQRKIADAISYADRAKSMVAFNKASSASNSTPDADITTSLPPLLPSTVSVIVSETLPDVICDDPVWCSIPMPKKSYYKFDPPVDERRWKIAQSQAASGEQVLLQRVRKAFPNPFDFLDGDKSFRKLHNTVDLFVDTASDFEALLPGGLPDYKRRLQNLEEYEDQPRVSKDLLDNHEELGELVELENHNDNLQEHSLDPRGEYSQQLEKEYSKYSHRKLIEKKTLEGAVRGGEQSVYKRSVVPAPYDFRGAKRAAILQIGYMAFQKNSGTYFSGNFKGGVFIKRVDFLQHWAAVKTKIDTPFVAMCVLNENWGWLSTMFPNRTAGWGKCCDRNDPMHKNLYNFLDHKQTLMLVVGQHSNISHPKIITMPRGLPLTWAHTSQMMWDAMRNTALTVMKSTLLFASTSSWGKRPQMLHCISQKFTPIEFEGHDETPKSEMEKTHVDRKRYYEKLGGAKFGVCLPGLGYDTFRMWELLTMGAVVIIERAVGYDRTLWRLPALLVDDFYDVTPDLLRVAYVEAIYRADEFEFERLTQSFWSTLVANVSATMSTQTLLDKFPMIAEEPNFSRPRVPFPCGLTDICGPGTNRVPKKSC